MNLKYADKEFEAIRIYLKYMSNNIFIDFYSILYISCLFLIHINFHFIYLFILFLYFTIFFSFTTTSV